MFYLLVFQRNLKIENPYTEFHVMTLWQNGTYGQTDGYRLAQSEESYTLYETLKSVIWRN